MSTALIIPDEKTYSLIYQTDQQLIDLSQQAYQQTLDMLTQSPSLNNLKDIREKVKAIEEWLLPKMHSRDAKIEAKNNLAEAIIRIERELGKWLMDMEKNKGGNPLLLTPQATLGVEELPTLADMSISYYQSSKWQDIAALPEEKLEEQLANIKESGGEITSGAIARHGQNYRRPAKAVTPPFPQDKYRCIVIDPPWPIDKIDRHERPQQGHFLDYPTMTIEEIGNLPIGDMAIQDGCHLYLWCTQKYLPAGLDLMRKWGFTYQCVMTWVKPTGITPFSWMYNTELVLFGHLGNLPLERMGIKLSFEAASNGHSVKPNVFYERVMQASAAPRLEMFSRQNRDGFTGWGNEL